MINQVLTSIFQQGQHLTAVYTTLNRAHNILTVVNAGHLPVLYMPKNGEPYWIKPNSDILGAFTGAIFECRTVSVSPEDRFFIFSDGLIESFEEPARTRTQGMDKFKQLALAHRKLALAEAVEKIIQSFSPTGHIFDDDVLLLGVDI